MPKFHIATILQLFTGITLGKDQEVLDLVAYMCPLSRFTLTSELIERCKKDIESQLSWIKEISIEGINNDNYNFRMKKIIVKYGELHEIHSTITVEELRFKKLQLTSGGPVLIDGNYCAYWYGQWIWAAEGTVKEFPWGDDKIILTNTTIN